jgi:hypothetical protein
LLNFPASQKSGADLFYIVVISLLMIFKPNNITAVSPVAPVRKK